MRQRRPVEPTFGKTCIRRGNGGAFLQDIDTGGVGSSKMVVIQSVLELQLPVRIERVADFARHDLKLSGRALVDDEIEKRFGLAEKIIEVRDVGGKARKDETTVIAEPGHAYQVVIGIVERSGILAGRAFRNRNIAAAAII
jgi:hypothetical protein